jgi:hypothetical protein
MAGFKASMCITVVAVTGWAAVLRYLSNWRTEQMRAIAQRASSGLLRSGMSVWFNDEPTDFFRIPYFEFIHPTSWRDQRKEPNKKKEVDTFGLDNNRINNDHHYCLGCRRRRKSF